MIKSRIRDCKSCELIDEKVSKSALAKFVFSHTSLAFFYGLFLFLYEIKFVRDIISVLHPMLIAWAVIIVLYDIFIRKIWRKIPFWVPVLLFSISAGITVIMTGEAGIVSGIKSWVLALIPLYAFFPMCFTLPEKRRKSAVMISFLGAALVVFVASLTALGLYSVRFGHYVTIGSMQEYVGMRYYIPSDPTTGILLYGLYVDTNHAAIYALAFAAYGILLFITGYRKTFTAKWKNVSAMVFGAVSAAVQLCYFPMANSRGGWLALAVALTVTAFFGLFCVKFAQKKRILKTVLSVLVSAAITVGTLGGTLLLRVGVAHLPDLVELIAADSSITQNYFPDEDIDSDPTGDTEIGFSKNETSFDGDRILIWKDTLQVFTKRPVFGTSPSNNQYYAMKYQVGLEKIGKGCAVHNSFLDLLLDYGVIGFVLLMVFWILCAVSVLRKRFKTAENVDHIWYTAVFAVIITVCASVTLSCTFINTTAMYFLMTISAGYLMSDAVKPAVKKEP